MIHFYIIFSICIILGYFLFKSLNDDYTFTDEIINQGIIQNDIGITTGRYFYIKRIYKNGKITIIKKEF